MKTLRKVLFTALLPFAAGCGAHGMRLETFPAPPGAKEFLKESWGQVDQVCAEVLTWRSESAIALVAERVGQSQRSERVSRRTYFSEDGEHGNLVSALAWSPSGRFFAYQTTSSGGHQPYCAPVFVRDLETDREVEMQDLLDRDLEKG